MFKFLLLIIGIIIVIGIVKKLKSNDNHDSESIVEKLYHKVNNSDKIEFKRKDKE